MFNKLKAAAFGKKDPGIQRSKTGTVASMDELLTEGQSMYADKKVKKMETALDKSYHEYNFEKRVDRDRYVNEFQD